ncbi:tol-pal system-associated acyl-CoA thioesterase [Photobacterium frigidiphilum]|uniref:Tol-pal system-associated acyl-CoA thioesterase n=1 Tax=Photobacterium frigidiphilum TaxID=264736 RepID=A0A2T3JPS1_9GAMM|nr:tol-pal system-associated acyl-CoA thioesterase [Photobacterium frigidiphilum]PSU51052.1 tol-pal system-associated acyl-CoA thioesterase [Photobacterium frigidiphilum]
MAEKNIFKWPITIYYEDTDVGGLVYHANYLKFFERARTELLRSIGVSQQELFKNKASFVVCHIDMGYLKGARLDEQLIVQTCVETVKKASIIFCQDLVNNAGHALCKATVKVACVNPETMKPTAIPQFIMSEISK